MKITIELESSYSAKIEVDRKAFQYGFSAKTGGWGFDDGISREELEDTLGGIVIQKICDDMSTVLQSWMPEEESPTGEPWKTWEPLSEEAAEELYDSLE